MGASDTETLMGGPSPAMPTTIWSCILRASGPRSDGWKSDWERIVRHYWKPAYHFIRCKFRVDNERAKDFTQAFFAHLIEGDGLANVGPEKGTFRTFLRVALRNFVLNELKAEGRQKRGGHLEFISAEACEEHLEDPSLSPEAVFEREWIRTVFQRAVEVLEQEFVAGGKAHILRAFRLYDIDGGKDTSYQDVAAALGVKVSDVRNYLHEARGRFRDVIVSIAAEYVGDAQDLDREVQGLIGLP